MSFNRQFFTAEPDYNWSGPSMIGGTNRLVTTNTTNTYTTGGYTTGTRQFNTAKPDFGWASSLGGYKTGGLTTLTTGSYKTGFDTYTPSVCNTGRVFNSAEVDYNWVGPVTTARPITGSPVTLSSNKFTSGLQPITVHATNVSNTSYRNMGLLGSTGLRKSHALRGSTHLNTTSLRASTQLGTTALRGSTHLGTTALRGSRHIGGSKIRSSAHVGASTRIVGESQTLRKSAYLGSRSSRVLGTGGTTNLSRNLSSRINASRTSGVF